MIVIDTASSFASTDDGIYQAVATVRQNPVKYFHGDGTLAEDKGATPTVKDVMFATYESGTWTANNVLHMQGSKGHD
ncbi:hypothetical protein JOF48_003407 [Arthrobacter stackebrandtii]|uniref:Uncharacterized protein n=1 Tax=Arthrobacter stackebrandtii TaxID=272161 RepID=A0ABS4Z0P9_9MICC|nr:hypothetical protein [Arthrobacter stackebrandtii]PYH01709.1 hypothetical protein CVV67_04415 [Arthrobacter stackebrandtii]